MHLWAGGVGVLVGKGILVGVLVPSVLNVGGDLTCLFDACQLGDKEQSSVNTSTNSRGSDELAILNPACALDPLDVRAC